MQLHLVAMLSTDGTDDSDETAAGAIRNLAVNAALPRAALHPETNEQICLTLVGNFVFTTR